MASQINLEVLLDKPPGRFANEPSEGVKHPRRDQPALDRAEEVRPAQKAAQNRRRKCDQGKSLGKLRRHDAIPPTERGGAGDRRGKRGRAGTQIPVNSLSAGKGKSFRISFAVSAIAKIDTLDVFVKAAPLPLAKLRKERRRARPVLKLPGQTLRECTDGLRCRALRAVE